MADERVARQLAFLAEADKLKTVLRRTPITDGSRAENSAEHSWHLVLFAMALAEYGPPVMNVRRVFELVTVHDLVEIDAGDTFAYDTTANTTKAARELAAAERIFALLPGDQAAWFRACWDEFEANVTTEAKFANALDRFQALVLNMKSGGGSWRSHHITRDDVLRRMEPVRIQLPQLWPVVIEVIERFGAVGVID
jgi:putative hydrolase of HD superfamily